MPSRKLLVERKSGSIELTEAIRVIFSMLEKKIRNLEKRKGKLETYKSELSEGVPLSEDQRIAAMKCDEVVQTLTFTKEVRKQLWQTVVDDRQAQIHNSERLERDTVKAREILIVQDVLSGLGDEATREDFLAGKNGALKLTEEKLESLDKLYKLITPCHDEEYGEPSFEDQLATASSHLAELVNSRVKDVLGTTYKELMDLILEIHNTEYFKSNFMGDPPQVTGPPDSYAVSESCGKMAAPSITETTGYEAMIESPMVGPSTIEPSPPPQPPTASTPTIASTSNSCSSGGSSSSANLRPACPSQRHAENRLVFSTFSQSTKPYEEILGDPKNSINFLLDSQIELDASHIDPAVVAVHSKLPPSALLNYNPGAQHPNVVHFLQRSIDDPIAKMTTAASTKPPSVSAGQSATNQFLQPSQIVQRAPAANFSQTIPPQTFMNQTFVNLQTFTAALYAGQLQQQQQQQQQSPPAQQQPPPQHQSLRQQQESTTAIQEPKKHLMNVNATTFESLSIKQPPLQPQPQPQSAQAASASSAAQFVHEDPPSNIPIADAASTKARTGNSPQFSDISAQDKQPENESERYKESNNYGNYGSGSRTNYNNHNHSSSNTNSSIGRAMTREGLARSARGSASNGFKGRGGRSPNNNYASGGRNAVSYQGNYSRDYHHHSNSYSRDNYEGASNGNYNNNNNSYYRRREGGGGGGSGGNTSGSGSASLRGNHRGGIISRGGNNNAGSNGGGNNRGNFRTVFNKSADPSA